MNSSKRPDALKKDSSLVNAAREGDVQALAKLCNEGADIDYQDSVGSSTALMTAANWGKQDCVEFLLSKGAKIDMQDKDGRTPLIFAVTMSRIECVKVLVSHGADPNRSSKNGWSPLYIACNKGSTEIVEILVNFPYATRHGVAKININIPNSVGGTSLMVASMHGHVDIVNILIREKSDVNIRDVNMWNALMKAADKGNTDVVRILLENEADVLAHDNNGFSSLTLAAKAGKEATVRALLENERSTPDINFSDKNGRTALFYASQNSHLEAVRELWSRGADVTIKDKNGNTALSVAKAPAVVSLLQTPPPARKAPAVAKSVTLTPSTPSAQSGEKSGSTEGAHVDALLQSQMGGLTFSSSLPSPPVVLSSSGAEPNVKMSADMLIVENNTVDMTPKEDNEAVGKRKAASSPPSAHKAGGFLTLQYAEIPKYLRGGEFFRSLNEDSEDVILVPENRYRPTDAVETVEDLFLAFHVMLFWVLTVFPRGVLHFCHQHDLSVWDNVAAKVFDPEDKLLIDLLQIFEDGASPLVRAIEINREEAVQYFVEAKFSQDSVSPCTAAAASGQLSYLKLLHEHDYSWDAQTCAAAARAGHLHCLQYAREKSCLFDGRTYVAAARGGNVQCMQYALDHGLKQWSAEVCSAAAEGGHLDCLMFARANGCPWDDNVTLKASEKAPIVNVLLINPAKPSEAELDLLRKTDAKGQDLGNRRFECLQFALQHNCPIHKDACTNAAAGGQLRSLQLLHDRAPPAPWDADTTLAAVTVGSLECLTYLHRQHCPWDTRAPEAAAKRGDVACLRYCIGNWCPYDADLMRHAAAARTGSLACLKYLIGEQGMYMNDDGYKFQDGQGWTVVDPVTFDDKLSQCLTLAYRFGWRWNDALVAFAKATTSPPLTKCCALLEGRGPPAMAPARTVPAAGGLSWPPNFKAGFPF